jgi:hypothetical protein
VGGLHFPHSAVSLHIVRNEGIGNWELGNGKGRHNWLAFVYISHSYSSSLLPSCSHRNWMDGMNGQKKNAEQEIGRLVLWPLWMVDYFL